MLVTFSHNEAAVSICCSQVAVGVVAFRVENSELGVPPTLVPSGMKL
jgi:hypothetical protein